LLGERDCTVLNFVRSLLKPRGSAGGYNVRGPESGERSERERERRRDPRSRELFRKKNKKVEKDDER
jgi:hypothetical protein